MVIIEPPHGVVDDGIGIFGALLREVEVDHGGLEPAMSQIALNDSGIDAGFKQVRGVAVP